MPLDRSRYNALIDVPRLAWDPTEQPHPRHGERLITDIHGVEVHWIGDGSVGDHGDTDTELLSFERHHEVTKSWTDLFYNVGADLEGNTYEGRDITVRSQSNLRGWLTFLIVAGSGDTLGPGELATIRRLIIRAWRAVDPALSPANIRTHRTRPAKTSCPGDVIDSLVRDLKAFPPTQETPDMSGTPFNNADTEAEYQAAVAAGLVSDTHRDDPATREQVAVAAHRARQAAVADMRTALEDAVDARVAAVLAERAATVGGAPPDAAETAAGVIDVRIVGFPGTGAAQ